MNEFFSHTTYPANGSSLSSAAMRAELDSIEAGFDKLPALAGQGGKVVRVKGDGTGLEAVASDAITSSDVHAAASKTTPIDADELPLIDSAASWGLKKLTWANLKATAKAYFDTLYAAIGHNHDGTYSPKGHLHTGVYEPANANLLETSDIGTTVQGYDVDTAKLDVAQQFTARQRTSPTTDNDLSLDLAAANDFVCTPTAGGTLTFTNITAGCKGEILLVNNSNYAIAKAAAVKCPSSMLTTISATGRYRLAYSSLDGSNVDVTNSAALA